MSSRSATGFPAGSPAGVPALDAAISRLVTAALAEDVGPGDVTALATIPELQRATGRVVARSPGVLSGLATARAVIAVVDPEVEFMESCVDGDALSTGQTVAHISGRARSILTLERTLLNFLQQLSGVATLTRRYVDAVAGTGVAIADTRKTTPGLRLLQKQAVRHGGGVNHRIGLYDAFMVKDNHIIAAGGILSAVARARATDSALWLTVEAQTVAEALEAATLAVDQILLDNMSPAQITEAVVAIRAAETSAPSRPASRPAIRIEVSGGVTLETVRSKALPGVDWISIGALTHSAPALDLALDLDLDGDLEVEIAPPAGRPA